jgi:hypothetical protein
VVVSFPVLYLPHRFTFSAPNSARVKTFFRFEKRTRHSLTPSFSHIVFEPDCTSQETITELITDLADSAHTVLGTNELVSSVFPRT